MQKGWPQMNDLTRLSLQKMSSKILQFAFLSQSKAGARKIRDLAGLPACLGFVGPLEIRLAQTKKDIRKVQRLRFKVFYEQGGARADAGRDVGGGAGDERAQRLRLR